MKTVRDKEGKWQQRGGEGRQWGKMGDERRRRRRGRGLGYLPLSAVCSILLASQESSPYLHSSNKNFVLCQKASWFNQKQSTIFIIIVCRYSLILSRVAKVPFSYGQFIGCSSKTFDTQLEMIKTIMCRILDSSFTFFSFLSVFVFFVGGCEESEFESSD